MTGLPARAIAGRSSARSKQGQPFTELQLTLCRIRIKLQLAQEKQEACRAGVGA